MNINNIIHKQDNYNISIKMMNLYNQIMRQYFSSIYSKLNNAEFYYPNFREWYNTKVIPDVLNENRKILLENRSNNIVGVAIVKITRENKLCSLNIIDEYKNRGIGLRLFERSFEALGTEKPFLTVSEEKLPEFDKVFRYYGFALTSVHQNLYRNNKKEYFFNER